MMRILFALCLCAAAALVTAEQDRTTLIAFRVDDDRVVASVRELVEASIPQFKKGQATEAVAKYGYPFLDLPDALTSSPPSGINVGDRWTLHTAAGQMFHARAERFVLGQGQCTSMLGVLFRIDAEDAKAFATVRTKYYVADARVVDDAAGAPRLGELPASVITPAFRARLEATLAEEFAREFPRVRAEAAKTIASMAASDVGYHRSWARARQDADAGLARGAGVLTYDAQPFRLTPDGVPRVFVRATWHVGSRQGFAGAFWVRADTGAIVWKNLRPAAWLRMFEFQGGIHTEQLGLVLNVVDRDRNGWGEVIFMQAGYEGLSVNVLEVSADGVKPAGISYEYGC